MNRHTDGSVTLLSSNALAEKPNTGQVFCRKLSTITS